MLFVPRLHTLMVGADGDGMEDYVPSPFPESHDDGIRLLFSGRPRPSLAFRQDSAPEGHRHVPPIVKHLLQHSANGVVGSVGAQDEPSVWVPDRAFRRREISLCSLSPDWDGVALPATPSCDRPSWGPWLQGLR